MPTQVENHAAGTASEQSPVPTLSMSHVQVGLERLIDLSRRNNLPFLQASLGRHDRGADSQCRTDHPA
jgi:hypothetical protein